jgi:hypothetical protein
MSIKADDISRAILRTLNEDGYPFEKVYMEQRRDSFYYSFTLSVLDYEIGFLISEEEFMEIGPEDAIRVLRSAVRKVKDMVSANPDRFQDLFNRIRIRRRIIENSSASG